MSAHADGGAARRWRDGRSHRARISADRGRDGRRSHVLRVVRGLPAGPRPRRGARPDGHTRVIMALDQVMWCPVSGVPIATRVCYDWHVKVLVDVIAIDTERHSCRVCAPSTPTPPG